MIEKLREDIEEYKLLMGTDRLDKSPEDCADRMVKYAEALIEIAGIGPMEETLTSKHYISAAGFQAKGHNALIDRIQQIIKEKIGE